MKIQPLKSYTPPAYPTFEESKQDARLLERLPRRWRKKNPIAPLLGTGILIQIAGSGCADKNVQDKDVKITFIEPREHDQNPANAAVRAIPATRVAPILEDALANDGRGGFGCVAISAPVFLSENEAMDLIEAELEKTGLKFHDIVTVDGLHVPSVPKPEPASSRRRSSGILSVDSFTLGDDSEMSWEERNTLRLKYLAEGAYTFDLGTADKSVVVKFLQTRDYSAWQDDSYGMRSTWHSYNLAALATEVRNAFAQRETGEPVVIGIFFEPAVYPEKNRREAGVNRGQLREDTKKIAKEKLRAQVRHFVEYLKQEGVVE